MNREHHHPQECADRAMYRSNPAAAETAGESRAHLAKFRPGENRRRIRWPYGSSTNVAQECNQLPGWDVRSAKAAPIPFVDYGRFISRWPSAATSAVGTIAGSEGDIYIVLSDPHSNADGFPGLTASSDLLRHPLLRGIFKAPLTGANLYSSAHEIHLLPCDRRKIRAIPRDTYRRHVARGSYFVGCPLPRCAGRSGFLTATGIAVPRVRDRLFLRSSRVTFRVAFRDKSSGYRASMAEMAGFLTGHSRNPLK